MTTYLYILFLLSCSAMFSGLSLGIFSLNKDDLKRKADLGDVRARKIYELRENGNLLLCTLLFGNVMVNSALSIFLGSITSGVVAGIVATLLIVVFGEIVPQAVFSRFAMDFVSRLTWLVKILIFIFYPLSRPISWALDKALGEEIPMTYSKREIMKIVEEHHESEDSDIDIDEKNIIKGALSFSSKTVYDILTPRTEVFGLPFDRELNEETIKKISEIGHSRIPVYNKDLDSIVGILYVKDILFRGFEGKRVGDMARKNVIFVDFNKPLDDLLNAFKNTRSHMFVVLDKHGVVSGIVTIEDVLEEIIGAEIVDEFDKFDDLQKLAKKRIAEKKLNKI